METKVLFLTCCGALNNGHPFATTRKPYVLLVELKVSVARALYFVIQLICLCCTEIFKSNFISEFEPKTTEEDNFALNILPPSN